MTDPITWNTHRSVWESSATALCGHHAVFTDTWAHTGIMVNGTAYPSHRDTAIPSGAPVTSLDVVVLPTPTVADTRDGRAIRDMSIQAMKRGSSKGINLNHLFESPDLHEFMFTAWGNSPDPLPLLEGSS